MSSNLLSTWVTSVALNSLAEEAQIETSMRVYKLKNSNTMPELLKLTDIRVQRAYNVKLRILSKYN